MVWLYYFLLFIESKWYSIQELLDYQDTPKKTIEELIHL